MKTHLLSFILFILASLQLSAANESDPVSMVSYEQGWLDYKGALALKNNTNEEINNVNFIIHYYEMDGTEMDYKEFYVDVNIAPGMTKKVDIESYEYDRHYSYYKSDAKLSSPHKFKISYELKGYNIRESEVEDDSSYDYATDTNSSKGSSGNDFLIGILVIIFILSFVIGLYAAIGSMARNRNRSATGFILLAMILTPLASIVILLLLGEKK